MAASINPIQPTWEGVQHSLCRELCAGQSDGARQVDSSPGAGGEGGGRRQTGGQQPRVEDGVERRQTGGQQPCGGQEVDSYK